MLGASWLPPPSGRYESVAMLFLTDEGDRIIPEEAVMEFVNRYSGREVRTFPGAGRTSPG
jgi:hypothetical protein